MKRELWLSYLFVARSWVKGSFSNLLQYNVLLDFFFRLSPAMFKFPKYCSNSFSSLRTKFKVWTFKCKSPYRKHFFTLILLSFFIIKGNEVFPNLRSLISLLLGLLEACKRNCIITHETLIRNSEELVQKCSVCACLPGRIKIWTCLSVFLGEAKTGKPGKHFLRLCRDENQPPANLCHRRRK